MNTTALVSHGTEPTFEEAKDAAKQAPLILTDEFGPSHVLLSIADYERLLSGKFNIVEMLWMPGMADVDLELKREIEPMRPIDLS